MPHGNSRGFNERPDDEFRPTRWGLSDGDDSDTSPGRSLLAPPMRSYDARSCSPSSDDSAFGGFGSGSSSGFGSQRYSTPLTSPVIAPPPFTLVTPSSVAPERISPFLQPQSQTPQMLSHMMGSPQMNVGQQVPQHFPRTTSLPSLNDGINLRQGSLRSISVMQQQQQQPTQQQQSSASARQSPPVYLPLSLNVYNEPSSGSLFRDSPGFLAPSLPSPQQPLHSFGSVSIGPTASNVQGFGTSSTKKFPSFVPSFSPQPPVYNPVQLQPQYPEETQRAIGQVPRQTSQPLLIYNRGAQQQQLSGGSNSIYPRTQSFSRLHPRVLSDSKSATNSAHGSGSGTPVSPYSQPTTPTLAYGGGGFQAGGFGRKANSRPLSRTATRSASLSSSPPASPLSSPNVASIHAPSILVTSPPKRLSARSMMAARHRRVLLEVTTMLFPGQSFSQCFKPLSSQEWTEYLTEREKVLSQRVSSVNN